MFGKPKRNLKVFVKYGKRYRVVYSTPDGDTAFKTVKIYRNATRYATVYFDRVTNRYLIGVRPRRN